MSRSHRPQRTCLGCGARDDKKGLIRVVLEPDGRLEVSRLGGGRGGYLHPIEQCWESFLRRKNVQRAFHSPIGREAREKLISILRQNTQEE